MSISNILFDFQNSCAYHVAKFRDIGIVLFAGHDIVYCVRPLTLGTFLL